MATTAIFLVDLPICNGKVVVLTQISMSMCHNQMAGNGNICAQRGNARMDLPSDSKVIWQIDSLQLGMVFPKAQLIGRGNM